MKGVFAKKFFGARRDSAGGALASVLRDTLAKSGHLMRPSVVSGTVRGLALQGGQGLAAPIQNEVGRSLISQHFLPRSGTNGYFRRTLRNEGFSRASGTTGDQRARWSCLRPPPRSCCAEISLESAAASWGRPRLLNEIVERLLKHEAWRCKVHSRRPNGPLMRFDDRATDRKSDPHPLQQFCAWQSYIGAKPMIFCSSNWATTRYGPW